MDEAVMDATITDVTATDVAVMDVTVPAAKAATTVNSTLTASWRRF